MSCGQSLSTVALKFVLQQQSTRRRNDFRSVMLNDAIFYII